MARSLHSFITALALVALLIAPAYRADAQSDSTIVAAHVSFDGGGVKILEDGASDATVASLNWPVLPGDTIWTTSGRAEVQIDEATVLRMAPNSQVFVASLAPSLRTFRIDSGTVEVRAFSTPGLGIQTSSLTFVPEEPGAYRVEVDASSTRAIVRQGRAGVPQANGDLTVSPGMMVTSNTAVTNVIVSIATSVNDDDFDAWNDTRDMALGTSATDKRVSPILAANALDVYGRWLNSDKYGLVWAPDEPPTWSPYSLGSWALSPLYGPMWVSSEPWGWAPYHYGRWVYDAIYGWIWIPDQGVASWVPALVTLIPVAAAVIDSPFGNVRWAPLGPGDLYEPWYDTTAISNTANNSGGSNQGKTATVPGHVLPHVTIPLNPIYRFTQGQRSIVGSPAHVTPGVHFSGGGSRGGGGGHASSGGGGGGHSGGGGGGGGGGRK